jgi:hypothetical protein
MAAETDRHKGGIINTAFLHFCAFLLHFRALFQMTFTLIYRTQTSGQTTAKNLQITQTKKKQFRKVK